MRGSCCLFASSHVDPILVCVVFSGTLLLAMLAALAPGSKEADAPPGMVLIPGGRTRIGIEQRELERLLDADLNSQNYAGSLSAETPRRELAIESFFLQVTEVTNEQFAAYVRASGARPPENWGESAIDQGRKRFFEHEAPSAASAGRDATEPAQFDQRVWWQEHWRESAWQVPDEDRARPVVFVDSKDARAYARWAGLRLPSEFEVQRAVRNDTNQNYPWGNEWDNEKFAATSMLKKKASSFPVGSFPAGASRQGVFDLAGNVWEWTSSSYTPYPGYEHRIYEFGYASKKRQVNALADWNASQLVVVGGSFQNSNLMARASVRRAADPSQSTDALGFRCAGSTRPGVDLARSILEEDLQPNLRPRDSRGMIEYAPEATLGAQHWSATSTQVEGWSAPPGYVVIERADHVLFTPVKVVPASEPPSLERLAFSEGPVAIGFFSSSQPMSEPALAAGTYLLSWRAKGAPRFASTETPRGANEKKTDAERGASETSTKSSRAGDVPLEEALKLDINFDQMIFTDLNGRPVAALPTAIEYGPWHEGRIEIVVDDPQSPADTAHASGPALRFDACLQCRTTKKGFSFSLPVRLDPHSPRENWRKD